jgi:hypothetical protein
MSIVITKDGKERGIREALDYLERAYSIPPSHIRAISVESEVGQPIRVSVTLLWQAEPEPEVTEVEVTQMGDRDRVFMRSDGTVRHEPRAVVPLPDVPGPLPADLFGGRTVTVPCSDGYGPTPARFQREATEVIHLPGDIVTAGMFTPVDHACDECDDATALLPKTQGAP